MSGTKVTVDLNEIRTQEIDVIVNEGKPNQKVVKRIIRLPPEAKVIPLTPDEILEAQARALAHTQKMAEYEKVKYLDQRKNDPDYPSQAEFIEAIYDFVANAEKTKLDAIAVRLKALEEKYPAPNDSGEVVNG